MSETTTKNETLLQVGEFARTTGKTVRAIHLYEELGLLRPARRTKGGFRLYHREAVERVAWISKLQAIGFSLTEIQGFVRDFEAASSAPDATARVRETFRAKREEIRQQIAQLQIIDTDLQQALDYLEACGTCSPSYGPTECRACDHQGHEPSRVPELFAGLSDAPDVKGAEPRREYDVDLQKLSHRPGGTN